MKRVYSIAFIILLAIVLFFPFYDSVVSPEWEIQFVNRDGSRSSTLKLDQVWKDYSLEWFSHETRETNLITDSNGYIKLPERKIRVSICQILSSKIRDRLMSINPHSSAGPSSYIICRGTNNCVVNYKESTENPQQVVLW